MGSRIGFFLRRSRSELYPHMSSMSRSGFIVTVSCMGVVNLSSRIS